MPSTDSDTCVTRRRILTGVGTATVGDLEGCSGQIPGTGPIRLDAETTVETDRDPLLLWEYPPREDDADGIGYAAVELDRLVRREGRSDTIALTFNSTVGGIASSEPYTGYRPDWFRFRIWPPKSYQGRLNHHIRVEPPGQWDGFSTHYDVRGGVRRTTVELRNVDTQGTIQVPAVFDPGMNGLPDRLHCSFTVRVSRPGFLGETVRVAEQGTLPTDPE